MDGPRTEVEQMCLLDAIWTEYMILMCLMFYMYKHILRPRLHIVARPAVRYSLIEKIPKQLEHLRELYETNDVDCISQLRFSRDAFARLTYLVENIGGLRPRKYVSVGEQLAIFLSILGHHTKNRTIGFHFKRSGDTVSVVFKKVLKAVLKLYPLLLTDPQPINENCENERWRPFQGCLGALDGTLIHCHPRRRDVGRFRSRKGDPAFNVLGVCDPDMKFVHVLSGWEGSAADSRVLREAIDRPGGLRVPIGNYYLVDGGYAHSEGFLAPYRQTRYHLKEWERGGHAPRDYKEYFNMRHAMARNVIERSFGLLKTRWAILRSRSFYPIKSQNRIILACFLLHNFARREMPNDPLLEEIPEELESDPGQGDYVEFIETSHAWNYWRDQLARKMFNEWQARRRRGGINV